MLVVIAGARDTHARKLVERWRPRGARLMTVHDLSLPGWQHQVGRPGPEWAVVDGTRVETSAIRGVLTRVPGVAASDLAHIAPEDRTYVAAEMNAFLRSWLSRLSCPVLNRPTTVCLMGPSLTPEHWLALAARMGLRIAERVLRVADMPQPLQHSVFLSVVGRRWIGQADEALGAHALRLAARAGVELLTVQFNGSGPDAAFVSAGPYVDITHPQVADALLERLHTRTAQ